MNIPDSQKKIKTVPVYKKADNSFYKITDQFLCYLY